MCGGQQRIVDQAKAQGNAWDTGVVPGHLSGWSRIPRAEEMKVNVLQCSYEGQAC